MPSITPPAELDQLLALIAAQPDGLGIDAIATLQGNRLPRRTLQATAEVYVPVSPEGEAIKTYVRQHRAMRAPVGYRQAFLEQYQPNHTAYLPPVLRDQLHTMGRARTEQTPAGTFARDILNRLLIDLSWASSMLEGNTYSRLDTERLIEFGQAAEGKPDDGGQVRRA